MKIEGSMQYKCERICTTYIETGRTIRSLADFYGCSKSTISNYLGKWAEKYVSYDLYKQARERAKLNMAETYYYGQSENRNSSAVGSMD